jgi:VanZ family protein
LVVLIFHTIPLGGDFDFTLTNTYVLDRLRLDHLMHSLLFLPTAFLFSNWFKDSKSLVFFFILLILSLIFAVLCETLQLILPYRAFTMMDLLANAMGASLGLLIFVFVKILKVA